MTQVSHQITSNFTAVDNISRTTARIDKNVSALTKSFTKLSGALQNAFQFYVRYRIFGLINRAISSLEDAIPSLIARGQEWARTVDEIADSSGLAADKASTLAGVALVMNGTVDGLTRALGALANNVANHGDVLERYGIATRAANGQLLDSWTILRNVRRATADLGNSFITTAAARELFSRGGQTLLDMLTMTDRQFRMLEQDVRASGVVMTEAARQAGEQWARTQARFEMQITGIANTIVSTLQPTLTRLVDGITNYLRQNMTAIVSFVTRVVGFVVGLVSGLLGIDLQVASFAESLDAANDKETRRQVTLDKSARSRQTQARGEDAYTSALRSQIDAIDRQLAAMTRAQRMDDARAEQRRLLEEIAEAKRELSDLRGKAIFAAGMTEREAELARQQQAADIIEAEKRVTDAQRRMQEHQRRVSMDNRRFELEQRRAALQEQLAEQMKAVARRDATTKEAFGQMLGRGKDSLAANIKEAMKAGVDALKEGMGWGQEWAERVKKDFGGAAQMLADQMAALPEHFRNLVENLGKIVTAIEGLLLVWGGSKLLPPFLGPIAPKTVVPSVIGNLGGGKGPTGVMGKLGGAILKGGVILSAVTLWMEAINTFNANVGRYDQLKGIIGEKLARDVAFGTDEELRTALESLKALPGKLDPLHQIAFDLSSGIFGLDTVLGNAKETYEQTIATLEEEIKRREEAAATQHEQQQTSTARVIQLNQDSSGYLRTIATRLSQPHPLGVANLNLYLDRNLALRLLNVPLTTTGNTSIRNQRAT